MKNAEQSDIDTFQQNEQMMFPPPGSTFVSNENVTRTAVQSTGISDSGRSRTFEELITAFAVGILVPKEYMGIGDAGTRASSITATEPAVKVFQDRRGVWETFIRKIVLVLAEKRGKELKLSDIEVMWPEIAPEDVNQKIQNILTGLREGFTTVQRSAEMYAKEMDIRGYDFQDEMKTRLKEMTDSVLTELYNTPPLGSELGLMGMGQPGSPGMPKPTPGGVKPTAGVPKPPAGEVNPSSGTPKPSASGIGAKSKGAIKKQYQ